MRIFVTGATGFIGSHLLAKLSEVPHVVLAHRLHGTTTCIDTGCEPIWFEKSMDSLDEHDLAGVEVLVHLASVGVSPRVATWQELFYWNVSVLLHLLEIAKKAGVLRVVISGSFAEYGRSADLYDRIPPGAPLEPTSAYAASKAAGYIASRAFAIENQIELCYLRIFSVYGEGQYHGNFWPALRSAALGGHDFPMSPGEQIRDYIPVEDVAAALLFGALRRDVLPGNPLVLNVGTGSPVSMRQFAERWWGLWGAKGKLLPGALPYRPNEPMRFVPLVEP